MAQLTPKNSELLFTFLFFPSDVRCWLDSSPYNKDNGVNSDISITIKAVKIQSILNSSL